MEIQVLWIRLLRQLERIGTGPERRAWRELNLIGFWFTFAIAAAWGYRYFQPPLFATTEPFLVLFFLFYQAIVLLYALRQPPERLGLVDGTLMFGTPVLTFALQSQLLRPSPPGSAPASLPG